MKNQFTEAEKSPLKVTGKRKNLINLVDYSTQFNCLKAGENKNWSNCKKFFEI